MEVFEKNRHKFFYSDFISYLCTLKLSLTPMDVAFILDKYFKGKDGQTSVIENGFWQGTLIYMEIGTSEEIDPNQIVDYRTDVAEEYNETFVETGELDSLW